MSEKDSVTGESLADFLRATSTMPDDGRDDLAALADLTAQEFCKKFLETRAFRQYLLNGIEAGDLPPAILGRIMDHAWGKPPEKVEHTGKDGQPIVTEIRNVIVWPKTRDGNEERRVEVTH